MLNRTSEPSGSSKSTVGECPGGWVGGRSNINALDPTCLASCGPLMLCWYTATDLCVCVCFFDETSCRVNPVTDGDIPTQVHTKLRTVYSADDDDFGYEAARRKYRYPHLHLVRHLSKDMAHIVLCTHSVYIGSRGTNYTNSGFHVSSFESCALKSGMKHREVRTK